MYVIVNSVCIKAITGIIIIIIIITTKDSYTWNITHNMESTAM